MFEAIEAVCNARGDLQIDVLDSVQSLVDKSLLRNVVPGAVGVAEEGASREPRFVMLETIHEFAREKLIESGEDEVFEREHALYFMAAVEQAEPHLAGPKQLEWLDTLEEEHDNMRAALRWANQARGARNAHRVDDKGAIEAPEIGLRIAAALGRFWDVRGHFNEGRRQLKQALSLGSMTYSDQAGATVESQTFPTPPSIALQTAQAQALYWAGYMDDDIDPLAPCLSRAWHLAKN